MEIQCLQMRYENNVYGGRFTHQLVTNYYSLASSGRLFSDQSRL